MLKKLYLSPLGGLLAIPLRIIAFLRQPYMVPGYKDTVSGTFRKLTRVSSSAIMECRKQISIGDNVWIGHNAIIDGSSGVTICDGVQISYSAGIFTHGSQTAVRLYGERYIKLSPAKRKGYTQAPVYIGAYSFIGAHAILLPGVTLGKGCLVAAGAVVSNSAPAFSILRGCPARIVGDVREMDARFMTDPELRETYFDQQGIDDWLENHAPGPA